MSTEVNKSLTFLRRIFVKKKRSVLNARTSGEKVLFAITFLVFLIHSLTFVFVFWWLFNNSLKGPFEYGTLGTSMEMPKEWLFRNYLDAFNLLNAGKIGFGQMILNSIMYTAISAFLGSFTPAVTGYVLSKYRFKGRNVIYNVAIVCMTLPIVGAGAAYMKVLHSLQLYNNPLYYVVLSLNGFGGNFLVYSAFFSGLSWAYAEAAEIDGANPWQIFFKIMFPQALPVFFTYVITSAIGCWNEYNMMILYMPDWLSLAAGLYTFRANAQRGANYPVYFAGLIVSMIPTMTIFAMFSGKIMTSLSIGGLKG